MRSYWGFDTYSKQDSLLARLQWHSTWGGHLTVHKIKCSQDEIQLLERQLSAVLLSCHFLIFSWYVFRQATPPAFFNRFQWVICHTVQFIQDTIYTFPSRLIFIPNNYNENLWRECSTSAESKQSLDVVVNLYYYCVMCYSNFSAIFDFLFSLFILQM